MKIVVVGGVAGGASAAARIRRLDEQAEIVMLEQGEHVSYSNCALPYYLGGVVKDSRSLLMMTPGAFQKRFNIQARVNSRVLRIDREEKTVLVQETDTGRTYTESYDKLVLAPGAAAVRPKTIAGADGKNVFTLKNVTDAVALKAFLEEHGAKRVAVLGGGFIGLEVAENLTADGRKVTLLEGADQVMAPLDEDMAQWLHRELLDNGVDLRLGTMVTEITDHSVIGIRGGEKVEVQADAAVLAIGVAPSSGLAAEAGLTIGSSGGIAVNGFFQTSDPDIYAVGDAVETRSLLTLKPGILALAGPAQREARTAADHICGRESRMPGTLGSSCLRLFGLNAACTGMNEKTAMREQIPYDVAYVLPGDKVGIMPDSHYMAFKLIFEKPSGKILGAQAVGRGDAVRRVDVIAALIAMGGTLDQLKDLELCYSPVFGTAKDVVNIAALVGLNLLHGDVRQVRVSEVRSLATHGAVIIDVREKREYEAGHIKGAVNIPLSQFRERIGEVPKDVPVYLHCRTSQRSYYALCQLRGHGYTNAYNISGSFLGLCAYEYFRDQTEGREPIVTAYNFE